MSSSAFLRRSSSSILLASSAQRLCSRPFSSSPSPTPPSSPLGHFRHPVGHHDPSNENSGLFFTLVSGIAIGSTLALSLFYPSSSASISFADHASRPPIADDELPKNRAIRGPLTQRRAKYLLPDEFRRKVFFNYEKRIRLRSSPEKVFEYFTSFKTPEGQLLMTPADLMRAVVPVFPPSESNIVREGFLRGERKPDALHCAGSEFFMLFDTNNAGLISFSEYIFFVTLLSLPESSFSIAFKMFDLDSNGEIKRDEFKQVMTLMRTLNRPGSSHRDGLCLGLHIGDLLENGGLVEHFFGKDGNESLQIEKFVNFLKELHGEILRLEFSHYDFKSQGTITAKDFALSMVASADMNHISKFLNRVDELDNDPCLRGMRITFEEFKDFAELRKKLYPLTLAFFSCGKVKGLLTKDDFQRAAYHVCDVSITKNVVDVIFHVFDSNHDGNLTTDEFLGVIQRREKDIAHLQRLVL